MSSRGGDLSLDIAIANNQHHSSYRMPYIVFPARRRFGFILHVVLCVLGPTRVP